MMIRGLLVITAGLVLAAGYNASSLFDLLSGTAASYNVSVAAQAQEVNQIDAPLPDARIAALEGIPQWFTRKGYPVLGNRDALVHVISYASFDCPHCGRFEETVMPGLVERAAAGDINIVYVPAYGTGGIPNGHGAARAALCAGQQDAFWSFHATLYSWQNEFGGQAFSNERLEAGASNLGLDMAAWGDCFYYSDRPERVLEAAMNALFGLQVPATPTIFVNQTQIDSWTPENLNAAIDAILLPAA